MTESGVYRPDASAAAETITLNADPGGAVVEIARLSSGWSGVVFNRLYAAAALVVSWLARGVGSKLGVEAIARILPVFGSIATIAPTSPGEPLLTSALYASVWTLLSSVRNTLSPGLRRSEKRSLIRSSAAALPAR